MDIKNKYINELLQNIKQLEARVTMVKQDATLSFSFFKDSFQISQEIMRLLHELEMQQIEDMKKQMEKLVAFLSENESQKKQEKSEFSQIDSGVNSVSPESSSQKVVGKDIAEISVTPPEPPVFDQEAKRNIFAENIELPTYINPRVRVHDEKPLESEKKEVKSKSEPMAEHAVNQLSVNDVLHASPSKIEVKRSLSLNDRFFYQRELFNNNREAMNSMMEKINSIATFEEIEDYLKDNTTWDFEDKTVKGFLELLK